MGAQYTVTVDCLDTGRQLWTDDAVTLADARRIAKRALAMTRGCRLLMVCVKPHVVLRGRSSTVAWDARVEDYATPAAIVRAAARCTDPRAWTP